MRCALVTRAGNASDAGVVSFAAEAPRPPAPGPGQMLLRVLASSFAAGDVHLLSGRVSLVFKPDRYPYIPGMDVCGAVVAVGPPLAGAPAPFKVGDEVAAFVQSSACTAEFVLVDTAKAATRPASVSATAAAASVTSGVTALNNNNQLLPSSVLAFRAANLTSITYGPHCPRFDGPGASC